MDEEKKRDGNRLYPPRERVSVSELATRLARRQAELEVEMLGMYGETDSLRMTVRAAIAELGSPDGEPMLSRIARMGRDRIIDVYSYANGKPPSDYAEIVVAPDAWWVSVADVDSVVSMSADFIEEAVRFGAEEDLKRREGRYSLRDAADVIAGPLGRFDVILGKLEAAALNSELPVYSPGQLVRHEYPSDGVVRGFYEEAYWNDLNEWLAKNEPRVKYRFEYPQTLPLNGERQSTKTDNEGEPKDETAEERRSRWLAWFEEEEAIKKHGALQRVANRESKRIGKDANRPHIGKQLKIARQKRAGATKAATPTPNNPFGQSSVTKVVDGKRQN